MKDYTHAEGNKRVAKTKRKHGVLSRQRRRKDKTSTVATKAISTANITRETDNIVLDYTVGNAGA